VILRTSIVRLFGVSILLVLDKFVASINDEESSFDGRLEVDLVVDVCVDVF
jgi:hypothetical protein